MAKSPKRHRIPSPERLTKASTVRFTEQEWAEVLRRSQKVLPASWLRGQILSLMAMP